VLPLLIRPGGGGAAERDPGRLADWLRERATWVQERLARHGALLLRGFEVPGPREFERVARAVDGDLKREYLGTSPRDALTEYVFSASELPDYYPIPQHCEMSFLPTPPRRVFFCCLREPAPGSGETPLADFRKVWRDLDPGLRERFEERGLRIVRNYSGPEGGGRFDLWKLKRWDEMFGTTDRAAVEARCEELGFELTWTGRGGLRLVSTQPVSRVHPVTGERVWHNHLTTFHLSAAPGEYARIQRLRPTLRHLFYWQLSRCLVAWKRRTPADQQALHCTFRDGSEIPDADVEQVREVIWRYLVIEPWRRGDVLVIDNASVAHGRLPYRGPRQVAVCWA
jgi:alpha-ketoglutarate-dependent taurine dioxygenase